MGQVILLLFLFFLPTLDWSFLYNASELGRVIFFRLMVELMLGLYWLRVVNQLTGFLEKKKKNIISLLVLTYLAWVFLTSLWGEFWPRSLLGNYFRQQGFFTLTHFVFFFLLIGLEGNRIKKEILSLFLSGGAILASFYAVRQAWPFLRVGDLMPEIAGSFGNPNFLGGYLAILLPFGIYLVQKRRRLVIFLLPQVLAVIFSGSKMAILLMTTCLSFYFFYFLKKLWLLPVVLGVLIFIFLPFGQEASPYENRSKIWEKGREAFVKRPIFGWGLENFEYAFQSVLVPTLERDHNLKEIRVDKAHNEFLEILVASGGIGLGLYLMIVFLSLRSIWGKMRIGENKEWWLAVFLSLVLFIMRSQVNPVSIPEQILFWLLVGLAAGGKEAREKLPKEFLARLRRSLSALIVLSLIFMVVFNLRSLMADYFFKKGMEAEVRGSEKAGDFFSKARWLYPWEEVYQLKMGSYN